MKKRADGRYAKQIQIGYHSDGRRKFKTVYGKTIREVESREREIKSQIDLGVYVESNKTTVKEWAELWLNTYKKNLKPNTYNVYKYCISSHFEKINNIQLQDLKLFQLQTVANEMIQAENYRAAQIFKSTISQMLEKAIENEIISNNCAKKISLPKKQQKPRRALTENEIKKILSMELPSQTRCFLLIMLYCGLRRGEAWALTKKDIDFKKKSITVSKTTYFDTTEKRKVLVGTPKSQASNRTILMPDLLCDELCNHISTIQGEYIFNGNLMTEQEFRNMWDRFIRAYKKEQNINSTDITPHMFRHTYATMLYHAGVDIKTAQYLLGHASIQITLDIYTHLQDGKEQEAVDKLNDFINKNNHSLND